MKDLTDAMEHAAQDGDMLQLVSFEIKGEEFGVDILKVQEIIRPIEITRVPNAPDFVEGVVNLRGRVLPVVDLRSRFGLQKRAQDASTRIIVVELADQVVGFLTDAVNEVLRVASDVIEPPPDLAIGIDAHYIRGVAKLEERLVILLDLDQVLSEEEQAAIESENEQEPAAA